jgi:serine/threonine-protein kinase
MQCHSCLAENPQDNRFCGSCGQQLTGLSEAITAVPPAHEIGAGAARVRSSDTIVVGGLAPGTILIDRYRIIGLLGRGGMGDVYRADDLKLGQPIALKFLPRHLGRDRVRRERFFAEVRITRQLAHPNICRVYDIAEANGQYFLTMEFIDGEDLASLLRRIGRLANEKAFDIARQLFAGMGAAHQRGVIHRDLKPANIMIDGHGRVRITDFGLAIASSDEHEPGDVSGTPAYMAPEQLAGNGATVRSDIYALGLILYEVCCGRRVFTGTTLAELRAQKEQLLPEAPSDIRPGIDPAIERVILRCLERDPRVRPASVAQLAAALPGGDPLTAAIAAGETPSPEMVAAAGAREGVRPLVATSLLIFFIVGTLTAMAINGRAQLLGRVPGKLPEVLAERARDLIKLGGYSDLPADSAYGFEYDTDFLSFVQRTDSSRDRWQKLKAYNPILFWYRQSPRPLEMVDTFGTSPMGPSNPPMQFTGEVMVRLDAEGRLRSFDGIPTPRQDRNGAPSAAEMSRFLSETGVDPSAWTHTEPERIPSRYADRRFAWVTANPPASEFPLRIEAAAYAGQLVGFAVSEPWTEQALATSDRATVEKLRIAVLLVGFVVCLASGIFFARRNLQLGRGDRRGAIRLALALIGVQMLGWAAVHHVWSLHEVGLFFSGVAYSLFGAAVAVVIYLALEPFARRRWPGMLISWTRLLSGDWRDSLVGRDILIGSATGVAGACLLNLVVLAPTASAGPNPRSKHFRRRPDSVP